MKQPITQLIHRSRNYLAQSLVLSPTLIRGNKSVANVVKRRRRPKTTSNKEEYPYGLNPVDYCKAPAIAPALIPPPPKKGVILPITIVTFFASGIYLFFNSDSATYDYWKRVERGGIIFGDDEE